MKGLKRASEELRRAGPADEVDSPKEQEGMMRLLQAKRKIMGNAMMKRKMKNDNGVMKKNVTMRRKMMRKKLTNMKMMKILPCLKTKSTKMPLLRGKMLDRG